MRRLRNLVIDRVDLVDRGTNPGAPHVALYKRHPDAEFRASVPSQSVPEPLRKAESAPRSRSDTLDVREETMKAIAKAGPTKAAAWAEIEKAADRIRGAEPNLTKEQAIDRLVSSREGVTLVKSYREALDYEVEHAPPTPEPVVSATADIAARMLDELAEDVVRSSKVSKAAAYEAVLGTREGQEMLARYRFGMYQSSL